MKRIILLFIGLMVFVGCSSPEEKAEKEDLTKLESLGFDDDNAQAFYNFSNSTKIIFKKMNSINDELEKNNFIVPEKDYKEIETAVSVSKSAYEKMDPQNADEYFSFLADNSNSSPLLILERSQDLHKKMESLDAALILNGYQQFLDNSITSSKIPDEKKDDVNKWFHSNNEYTGIFKKVFNENSD
ncbi:hypothetical protein [Enterococcus thailandicus]|uniref:hypothetical protein n=1 Tax=Enterococcus thailandicus TaxID=417368 RepID=UPI0022E72AB6|nr:hypothetical protein [Enterococcus thailandicus]